MKPKNFLLPLLLQPKYLGFRNYWRFRKKEKSLTVRDTVIILFGVSVMFGIYKGGLWILDKAQADRAFVYFHPSLTLGLMLVYLFAMLLLSNVSAAIASLYLSQDLDLILSSPVRRSKFFWGKFVDVLFTSSWVTMVFILPAIYSFARYYQATLAYYFFVIAVLLPYFMIPTAFSIIAVTLYSRVVPASRTREVLFLVSVFGLFAVYGVFSILFPSSDTFSFRNVEDILRLVSILSVPNTVWSPSYWASTCLAEYLEPTKSSFLPYFIMLYAVAVALIAAAFFVVRWCHFEAYSKALSHRRSNRVDSVQSQARIAKWLFFLPRPVRAQMSKEYKLFVRDASQLFQVLLLSGICLLYFYNFRIIHGIQEQLPEGSRQWWGVFIFMINTYIEAFLITAVGTRFVFQSVSLEGRSFWVIQSSPLALSLFLRTKFYTWLFPVAIILSAIFGAGAYAVGAPAYLVFLKVVSSWVICVGIVGLGIGYGAYFANFSWEHSSQLAASFGSLAYMFSCVFLVSLDMALIGLVLVFEHFHSNFETLSTPQFIVAVISTVLLLIYTNVATTRWALALGERELERRMA